MVVKVLGVTVVLIGVWLEESVEIEVIVEANSGRGVEAEDSLEWWVEANVFGEGCSDTVVVVGEVGVGAAAVLETVSARLMFSFVVS
jgi:hypothetical protein